MRVHVSIFIFLQELYCFRYFYLYKTYFICSLSLLEIENCSWFTAPLSLFFAPLFFKASRFLWGGRFSIFPLQIMVHFLLIQSLEFITWKCVKLCIYPSINILHNHSVLDQWMKNWLGLLLHCPITTLWLCSRFKQCMYRFPAHTCTSGKN